MAQKILEINPKKYPFVLTVPNIRSGHNVGAMFRTADGAGVDKIYLCGYSPRPPHHQVDKVSLGAEKSVPWVGARYALPLLKKLKIAGYHLVALEQTPNSVSIYRWRPARLNGSRSGGPQFPLALIVGNEKTGVPPPILKLCDTVVHLPMRGAKNSLNVSVAAGIALYYISAKLIHGHSHA
ncbi:MAG: RNA methyltransferase [Candidatus Magasanikbacteria bacterium]|nr:RNA methyltransferase [Candidatus Magasanikbacteria bacterium]